MENIINKIKKQRKLVKRWRKRFFAVKKAEQRLLKQKLPKAVSKILTISSQTNGKDMEEFVKSHKVGADAWRRTGALTFDGNSKVGPKVTYKRIQEYLCKKYNIHWLWNSGTTMCCS